MEKFDSLNEAPRSRTVGYIIEDKIEIAAEYPHNPGAITKTTLEITYSGDIYIGVTPYYDDYGEYTLDLEITKETGIFGGKGQDVIDYEKSGSSKENGKLPGFKVVFTVAGLLSVVFLLKRK